MPLKFLGPDGGYTSDAVLAIQYATREGARIINASWGGGPYDVTLEEAIADFGGAGGIFVAAAGNASADTDSYPHYPSSYGLSNIISVAATDSDGSLAYFSNYGQESVDIAAPGASIINTVPRLPRSDLPGAVTATGPEGYRAALWGFGAEDFTDDDALYDAITRTMDYLAGGTAISNVLLVDADGSDYGLLDVRDSYLEPLRAAGYNVAVWERAYDEDGPSSSYMENYDAVVWATGHRWNSWSGNCALTLNEVLALGEYLMGGGKLFLSGRDAIWNNEETALVQNYFHVDWAGEWNWSEPLRHEGLVGVGGDFSDADYDGQWVSDYYVDFYEVNDTDYAEGVLTYAGGSYDTAYTYLSGTSMATPHVSATAALVLSERPYLNADDLVDAILTTGRPSPWLGYRTATGRIVNARRAVDGGVTPGVTLSSEYGRTWEDPWYGGAPLMVVLDAPPSGTVTVKAVYDSSQVVVSPASLTFTAADWDIPRHMSAAAVDDKLCENAQNASYPYHCSTICLAVSGADYAGVSAPSFQCQIRDNDMLIINETGGVTKVREGDYGDTYTVALPFRPDDTVFVDTQTWSGGDITLVPDTLVFTPDNWKTPQTITVSAPDDSDVEPTYWHDGIHWIACGGANYRYLAGWNRYVAIYAYDDDGARPPRFLTAETDSNGVRLSWLPPAGGPDIERYRVDVSSDGKNWRRLSDPVPPGEGWTTFVVTPDLTDEVGYLLTPGKKHFFRVEGEHDEEWWENLSRPSLPATATAGPIAPSAPKSLKAWPAVDGVSLSWLAPTTGVRPDGFRITMVDTVTGTPTTFYLERWDGPTVRMDLGELDYASFVPGRLYAFTVQSYIEPELDGWGVLSSKPSSKACSPAGPIIPLPPTGLIVRPTMTGAYLSWKPPAKGIVPSGYVVNCVTGLGRDVYYTEDTSFDADLDPGTPYSFEVYSLVTTTTGEGEDIELWSDKPATAKCVTGSPAMPMSPPTAVKAGPSNDCIYVTWREPAKGILPDAYEVRMWSEGYGGSLEWRSVKYVERGDWEGTTPNCEVRAFENIEDRAIPYIRATHVYSIEVTAIAYGPDGTPYEISSTPAKSVAGPLPAAPTALKATKSFEGVLLTWQPPKGQAPNCYRIYMALGPRDPRETWLPVADVPTDSWLTPVPSFEVTRDLFGDPSVFRDGNTYYFYVYSMVDDPAGGDPIESASPAKASAKAGDWE